LSQAENERGGTFTPFMLGSNWFKILAKFYSVHQKKLQHFR